jgi:hypothetical protein
MSDGTLPLADAPMDIVGIREAARTLKLSASTLSRQVRSGIIPNRGTPQSPKVSLAEVKTARAENLDPAQQRQSTTVKPAASGYQGHRSDLEEAKAAKARLELAAMLGQTLARQAVEDAIETATRELRDTLSRRWRVLAVELEGLTAREIEAKGLASDEAALAELVRKFERDDAAVPAEAA